MGLRDLIGLREAGVGPDAVLADEVEIDPAPPSGDASSSLRPGLERTAVEFAVSLRPDGKPLAFVMGPMIGLVAGDRALGWDSATTRAPSHRPLPARLADRAPRLVIMADGGTRSSSLEIEPAPLVPGIRSRAIGRRSAERAVKDALRAFERPPEDTSHAGHLDTEEVPVARPAVEKPDPDADPLWWL